MNPTAPKDGSKAWKDLFQAGTSATCSTLATNPLLHWQFCRVEKVPFHLQDIWRGLTANFASYIGFLGVAHLTKGALKRNLEHLGWKKSDNRDLLIGAVSGAASAAGVCPGERIATMDNKTGAGTRKLLVDTLKYEGLRGLYRGFLPTLWRDSIAVGGLITGGPLLKDAISRKGLSTVSATTISSFVTGFLVVVATQPLQVARIRMQVDPELTLTKLWKEVATQNKDKRLLPRIKPYYNGLLPRTAVNIVLVGCSILVDDRLDEIWERLKRTFD